MPRFLPLVALALATLTFGPAARLAADLYSIDGPAGLPGYTLHYNVKGQVRLIKLEGGGNWRIKEEEGKGAVIQVASDDEWNHWYLSYDVTGKSKEVFLTKELGPGCYWNVDPRGDKSTDTIAALNGVLKSRLLNVGDGAEVGKGPDGKKYTAYTMVLEERPRSVPWFTFNRYAP
jgi:hypothetical protein